MTQGALLALRTVEFFVPGTPVPQGSMRAVPNMAKRRGKTRRGPDVFLVSDNPELTGWRNTIAGYARVHWPGPPTENAVIVECEFLLPRVKHTAAGDRTSRGRYPTGPPDRDKLLRAVHDALAKIVYRNDSQSIGGDPKKRFAEPGESLGVRIRIEELSE